MPQSRVSLCGLLTDRYGTCLIHLYCHMSLCDCGEIQTYMTYMIQTTTCPWVMQRGSTFGELSWSARISALSQGHGTIEMYQIGSIYNMLNKPHPDTLLWGMLFDYLSFNTPENQNLSTQHEYVLENQ